MTSRSQHIDGLVERLRRLPLAYTGDLSMSRVYSEIDRDAERFGIEPVAAFGAVVQAWEDVAFHALHWHLPSVRMALRSHFGVPLKSVSDLDLGYILVRPGSPGPVRLQDPVQSMLLTQVHLEGPEREKLLAELEDGMAQC